MIPRGEFLFGLDPILTALRTARRSIFHALYLSSSSHPDKFAPILALCKSKNIPIRSTDSNMLRRIVGDEIITNGVIMDCAPLYVKQIDKIPEWKQGDLQNEIWVVIDGVQDPQNLGALMRSSLFFGVQGVVVSKRNSAPISPVVSKGSAGAMEALNLYHCGSVAQLLKKSDGRKIGLCLNEGSEPLQSVDTTVHGRWIVVMGSESTGLREVIRAECAQKVKILGNLGSREINSPVEHSVDSLNVSNALAIVLYHLGGKL